MATESRRIALADPHHLAPPRFLVGGQLAHMLSGDVKLYEWDRDVSLVRIPSSMRSAMPVSAAGKDVHARPADRDRPDQSTRLVALSSPQTSRRSRSFHRQDTPPQPLPVHPVSPRRRPPSVGPRHCRPHSQAYTGRHKHILFPARRQLSRYRSRTASVGFELVDLGYPRCRRCVSLTTRRRRALYPARTSPPDNDTAYQDILRF